MIKAAAAKKEKKKKKGAPEQECQVNVKLPLWEILALWSTAKREHEDGIHWLPSPKRENPRRPWMCIKLDVCASSQQFMVSK